MPLGDTPIKRGKSLEKILKKIYDPYGERDNLIDILTDLRHLADNKNWDFGDADRIAFDHYSIERQDRNLDIAKSQEGPNQYTRKQTDVIALAVEQYKHDKNLGD